jgi:hypothetical protein
LNIPIFFINFNARNQQEKRTKRFVCVLLLQIKWTLYQRKDHQTKLNEINAD